MKTCSRCGEDKPVEAFRKYYNREGTYRFCKECERIEARRKYLLSLGDVLTPDKVQELDAINRLYSYREAQGLDIPGKIRPRANGKISAIVDEQLVKYENM